MKQTNWWKNAVLYQIYPRSFCDSNGDGIGDIEGIISKLDYIKNLGIDVIWLSPICKSPKKDNGYDISDYRDIDSDYGTLTEYQKLIFECHKRGMKILMDLVVNHSSDENAWFKESKRGKNNDKSNYYVWRDGKNDGPPNNWGAVFGGSAWNYCEERDQYYLGIFCPYQPDLNWDNPVLRKEIFDMMRYWLDMGVDGFRMDAIGYISKPKEFVDGEVTSTGFASTDAAINGEHVHDYMREMREKVLSYFDTMTVGENSISTVEQSVKYASLDGKELNMLIGFDHVSLDNNEYGKWNDLKIDIEKLKMLINTRQTSLMGKAWEALYWNNHDQPRVVSRLGNDNEKYRDISAKMIATNLHFLCGTPFVYQGEELGMTNCKFNSLSELNDLEEINSYKCFTSSKKISPEDMIRFINLKGRDNARTPMQWSSSDNAGFTSGKPWLKVNPNYTIINADAQLDDEKSVYNYYKKLIKIRKSLSVVTDGKYIPIDSEKEIFAYVRENSGSKLLVVCNFSDSEKQFDFSNYQGKILLCNYDNYDFGNTLRPYEAKVIYFDK